MSNVSNSMFWRLRKCVCLFVLKQGKKKIVFNLFGLSSLLVFSQSLTNKIANWSRKVNDLQFKQTSQTCVFIPNFASYQEEEDVNVRRESPRHRTVHKTESYTETEQLEGKDSKDWQEVLQPQNSWKNCMHFTELRFRLCHQFLN